MITLKRLAGCIASSAAPCPRRPAQLTGNARPTRLTRPVAAALAIAVTVAAAASRAVPAQSPAATRTEPLPRPEPVVDNGEFMDLFLKSSYSELQQAMAAPPGDRKSWATIYQKAIRLAEMQNLLFFRDRDEVKDPRWAEHCAAGRQAAADLANAALFGLRNLAKADFGMLHQKHLALVEACNACHTTFARDAPTIKP
jgi:hypothetical protein